MALQTAEGAHNTLISLMLEYKGCICQMTMCITLCSISLLLYLKERTNRSIYYLSESICRVGYFLVGICLPCFEIVS